MAYPFGKYDQLFVPEYNMGAMENAGAVTFRDDYIFRSRQTRAAYAGRANTVLHEMAHMWFGDLVTMRVVGRPLAQRVVRGVGRAPGIGRGDPVRRRRGPTSATRARPGPTGRTSCRRRIRSRPTTSISRRSRSTSTASRTPRARPHCASWSPGWARTSSWPGCAAYFQRHAFGNTELGDLLKDLEDTSGRELGSWSKEWLQTSGVNTLRPVFETDAEGAFSVVRRRADPPPDFPTPAETPHRRSVCTTCQEVLWRAAPRSRSTSWR